MKYASLPAFLFLLAASMSTLFVAEPTSAQSQDGDTQFVQVILLSANRTGTSNLTDLPANARQAVEDIREFLPFGSYQMLDASLMRGNRKLKTVMRGLDETEYEISITLARIHDTESKPTNQIAVREFSVKKRAQVTLVERRIATGVRQEDTFAPVPEQSRTLIQTSFTAEIGNTLVVGSSNLGGDQALVVLFTALP